MRGIRTGIALICGALALSGCAVFEGTPTASQSKTIGSVAVHFTVCASQNGGSPPAGSCPSQGNSSSNADSDPAQVWLGFRVPTGSVAPAKFTSTSTGPDNTGPQLAFTSSTAYTHELQRLEPAAKGQEWVGYVSQYVDYSSSSGDQNFTATVDFGLPHSKSGAPYAGPFRYQLVVGGRQYEQENDSPTTPPTTEPIDCDTSATSLYYSFPDSGNSSGEYGWICVDASSPSALGDNASLATRDAGIVPGKKVTGSAGKTAEVPFKFEYAGAKPGASFKLKASTKLHGAKLSLSPTSITPTGTSSKKVTVKVRIPASARAGTYTVKLTAKLPDGESRTGTDRLVVKG